MLYALFILLGTIFGLNLMSFIGDQQPIFFIVGFISLVAMIVTGLHIDILRENNKWI